MSGWTDFPNWTHGQTFRYFGEADAAYITESGMLRPDADRAVRTYPECAAQFLKLLAGGELDLYGQEGIARLLLDVGDHCRRGITSAWASLSRPLDVALQKLSSDALAMLREQGHETVLTDDDLSENFAYGPDVCIRYGLSVARSVAQATFLSELAAKMLRQHHPQDLCGEWELVITDPQDAGFAGAFAGLYGGGAHARIIETIPGRRWQLAFLDFPAFRPWYGLEGAAYEAAAALVAQTLGATVCAQGRLAD